MPTLIIDGKEITVDRGATIMEAAKKLGIFIPHFCYHPKLTVDGNCRMCLVEVEKMPKPVVACAMPVNDGMVVKTGSAMVVEARKGVMEFLLINHPLDCPVCDQGGECDLQDFSMKFGPDRSSYHEGKRHTEDRDIGPLIETVMDRCIHCTRCIRFSMQIAGLEEMGAVDRGDRMQVGPCIEATLTSELAGNMAEVCPVGALNLKPFHYQARSWELKRSEGICNHCSVGCHVRRDFLDGAVKRVMTGPCDAINEAWLCDKGRFSYDGLTEARLTHPQVRRTDGVEMQKVSWSEALDQAADLLKDVKPEEVAGLASDHGTAAEELFAFQDLLRQGVGTPHIDHRLRQRDFSGDDVPLTRADLLMNTSLENLAQADAILLVGTDPRFETPILNLRIRQAVGRGASTFSVTPRTQQSNIRGLTQSVVPVGGEGAFLQEIIDALAADGSGEGEAAAIATALKAAERPAVILGDHAINHPDAENMRRRAVAILDGCGGIGGEWNGFNRVSSRASASSAQDLGVVPHRGPGYARIDGKGKNATEILKAAAAGEIKVLFLLGADPLSDGTDAVLAKQALTKSRVILLASHESLTSRHADVLLPGLAISEKDATLTNCEGRVQRSNKAVDGPGESPNEAKDDWRILRALSDRFAASLAYNDIAALRRAMAQADHRYNLDGLAPGELAVACDHSPVTTSLKADAAPAVDAPSGSELVLVLEPAMFHDHPVVNNSATLKQLDRGGSLSINPDDARDRGVEEGQKVRIIQGERTVETTAVLDQGIPRGTVFGNIGYADALMQQLCTVESAYPKVSLAGL